MSSRWPEDITLKFVTRYLENECLWNIRSLHYKNNRVRQAAYLDLQNTMNIPGFGEKEIKMKIRNIRSTYSQEIKKIKDSQKSGAGPDTVYVPTVKWFNMLDACLRNNIVFRRHELSEPKNENDLDLQASNNSNSGDSDTEQNSYVTDTYLEIENDPLQPPTKKIAQFSNMVSQINETETADHTRPQENEFDIFGKHVSVQLKSLPILLALEAQEHIQLYLNKIRRQHIQNSNKT